MSLKWTPDEEYLLKDLLPNAKDFSQLAQEFKERSDAAVPGFRAPRSADAIRHKCEREGYCLGDTIPKQEETHKQLIQEIQSKYKEQSITRNRGITNSISRKILSLSDIHYPLARQDLIDEAISDHYDADIVILNGDIMEGYIWSTFAKSKRIAAVDEYRCAFELVKKLSKRFPKVVLVPGNHDIRVAKTLKTQGLPDEASQVLRPDLIARIANGEELDATGHLVQKHDFSNVYYEARESWYVKIGKTIFMHPHTWGSGLPGGTVHKMGEKLLLRYNPNEVDSFVCGHTHAFYKGVVNNILYIEQGCLCDVMQYLHAPSNMSTKNYMNGYAVIYQDKKGNTDFNLSGPIFLGDALPPKKEILF